MKPVHSFICNSVAALAGRIMLYSYQLYIAAFHKRSSYTDMLNRLPVKREVILLKSRQRAAVCNLN